MPETQLLGATGSGGVWKEKGGMCPWLCPPCGRRGQGCTPGTCLQEVNGALPALFPPWPAGGKRFAKEEGGACVSPGLCTSTALIGIRHGENAGENGEEMACRDASQEGGFSTLAPHQCLPDSGMHEEQAQSLLPRLSKPAPTQPRKLNLPATSL